MNDMREIATGGLPHMVLCTKSETKNKIRNCEDNHENQKKYGGK